MFGSKGQIFDGLDNNDQQGESSKETSSPPRDHLAEHQRVKQQLERCTRWLSTIPTEEALAMQHTREYRDFIKAFDALEQAHRHVLAINRLSTSMNIAAAVSNERSNNDCMQVEDDEHFCLAGTSTVTLSFLQHLAADDVVLRVFEFLECHSLIRASLTCCRFGDLAHKSAQQRTQSFAEKRQLNNVMQLLRAKEQIDGIVCASIITRSNPSTPILESPVTRCNCHVRVPTLLLSRRVCVTNCGDPEFNGIFYCTGSNGNGFVFTKPRCFEQRVVRSAQAQRMILPDEIFVDLRLENEMTQPGDLLRCTIAKRFSNETILWYLSKEVVATEDNGEVRAGDITQIFCFWAKLMVIGDASPDICRYPSQSSILARHDEGWQNLSTTRAIEPPIVELLD